jgi:hypothetical protein
VPPENSVVGERSESMRMPTWLLVLLLVAGIILVVVLMSTVVIAQRSFVLRKCPGSLEAPALLIALIHRSAWNRNSANFARNLAVMSGT